MEAVGRVQHPNVVRATDAGEFGGVHCLVMELLAGMDLAAVLRQLGRLPVSQSCEVARQTAAGLAAIERHQLIHRDIKPSNLFLTADGRVKILDLGLARLAFAEGLTRTDEVFGTGDYIAPEQASRPQSVDIRADVYSLGCTLYKALAGVAPFETTRHNTLIAKVYAHVHEPPPPLLGLRADIPRALAELVHGCIEKAPARRPLPDEVAERLSVWTSTDASERLRDVVRSLEPGGAGGSAKSHESSARVTGMSVETSVAVGGVSGERSPRRPIRLPKKAVVGAVVVLAAVGTALWLSQTEDLPKARLDVGDRTTSVQPLGGETELELKESSESPETLPPSPAAPVEPLGVLRSRQWRGTKELSSWDLLPDSNALRLYSDSLGMVSVGTVGEPDFEFEAEIAQLDRAGGGGLFLGYGLNPETGKIRFRRIGFTRVDVDRFLLMHVLEDVDTDGGGNHVATLSTSPVIVKDGKNHLRVRVRDGQVAEVEWNNRVLLGAVASPTQPLQSLTLGEIGVYCIHSSAVFSSLQVNRQALPLRHLDPP
jgi:serine/threonine protein kinase